MDNGRYKKQLGHSIIVVRLTVGFACVLCNARSAGKVLVRKHIAMI